MLKGSGDFNEECFHKCGQYFSKELTIPWAAVSKYVIRGEQPSTVYQSWAGKLWLTESRKGWGQTTVRVSKVIFQVYPETKIEQGFCLALPLTGFCFRESKELQASCHHLNWDLWGPWFKHPVIIRTEISKDLWCYNQNNSLYNGWP